MDISGSVILFKDKEIQANPDKCIGTTKHFTGNKNT
jgi:hypothetical protein